MPRPALPWIRRGIESAFAAADGLFKPCAGVSVRRLRREL
jgi:hypothetical protein